MNTQDDATLAAALKDRVDIMDAVHRFAAGQDFHDRDLFTSAFTEDAVMDFAQPGERFGVAVPVMEGRDAILGQAFPKEQRLVVTHSVTNHRVTIDGDEATLLALVEAQHVVPEDRSRHFLLKNLYDVRARREAPGWRMSYVRIENLWHDGDPSVMFPQLATTS